MFLRNHLFKYVFEYFSNQLSLFSKKKWRFAQLGLPESGEMKLNKSRVERFLAEWKELQQTHPSWMISHGALAAASALPSFTCFLMRRIRRRPSRECSSLLAALSLASERARGETGLQLQQRHYLQAVKGNLMLLTQLCHIHKNASTQRACRCTFFSLRIPILYVWRIGEIDRFCVCCCRPPAQARQHLRWALRDCTIRVPDPTRTDSISTIANWSKLEHSIFYVITYFCSFANKLYMVCGNWLILVCMLIVNYVILNWNKAIIWYVKRNNHSRIIF